TSARATRSLDRVRRRRSEGFYYCTWRDLRRADARAETQSAHPLLRRRRWSVGRAARAADWAASVDNGWTGEALRRSALAQARPEPRGVQRGGAEADRRLGCLGLVQTGAGFCRRVHGPKANESAELLLDRRGRRQACFGARLRGRRDWWARGVGEEFL